jgi:hypothetical protein
MLLEDLVHREGIDFVVANGENSAGGNGITAGIASELFGYGVDVITTGDHVWDQKETASFLMTESRVLRPANYPPGVPGNGSIVWNKPGLPPVAVLNLQARTVMPPMENPFLLAQSEVARLRTATKVILVDFHGEATSEKIAMGRLNTFFKESTLLAQEFITAMGLDHLDGLRVVLDLLVGRDQARVGRDLPIHRGAQLVVGEDSAFQCGIVVDVGHPAALVEVALLIRQVAQQLPKFVGTVVELAEASAHVEVVEVE